MADASPELTGHNRRVRRENAEFLDAWDAMDTSAARSAGLRYAITVTRRHRDIEEWAQHPGEDSAHDEVVRAWRQHPATMAALRTVRPGKDDSPVAAWLLDAALRCLEDDDLLLRVVYACITGSERWQDVPHARRDLYDALHAKAASRGRFGGAEVLCPHLLAIDLVRHLHARERPLSGITHARVGLVRSGVLTAVVGEKWTRGEKSRGTVYTLLPPSVLAAIDRQVPLLNIAPARARAIFNAPDWQFAAGDCTWIPDGAVAPAVSAARSPHTADPRPEVAASTLAGLVDLRRRYRAEHDGHTDFSGQLAVDDEAADRTRRCDDDEEPGAGRR